MPKIRVQICKSHRPNVLAAATTTIQLDGGGSIELHDCRLLRNKSGILWVSLPTFSVALTLVPRRANMPVTVVTFSSTASLCRLYNSRRTGSTVSNSEKRR